MPRTIRLAALAALALLAWLPGCVRYAYVASSLPVAELTVGCVAGCAPPSPAPTLLATATSPEADRSLGYDVGLDESGSRLLVRVRAGGSAQVRVHLVLDLSAPGRAQVDAAIDAALGAVALLRPEDEVQIVVGGREVLAPTPAGDRTALEETIRALAIGRNSLGLDAALGVAYGASRPEGSVVLVIGDGAASAAAVSLAASASAQTIVLGLGPRAGQLRGLAVAGHGTFHAATPGNLAQLVAREIEACLTTAARNVGLRIALAHGVEVRGALPDGVVQTELGAEIRLASLATGEEREMAIGIDLPPGALPQTIATVDASWTPAPWGPVRHLEKTVGARAPSGRIVSAGSAGSSATGAATAGATMTGAGASGASGTAASGGSATGSVTVAPGSPAVSGAGSATGTVAPGSPATSGAGSATGTVASGSSATSGAGSTATGTVASGSSATSGAAPAEPTGRGRGLVAISTDGVTVAGRTAALDLLRPLAGFGADSRVGGDGSFGCDASLAHDALPSAGGATSVVVRLAGGAAPAVRGPLRVHLVIDASTSMAAGWDSVLDAARALLGRLRADDELQIVVYGDEARQVLAPLPVGDGRAARQALVRLRPHGQSHLEAGLRLAYDAIRPGTSLVVLLSDGVPQGGLSLPSELGALAAEASARGAVTTTIGLGWDFHPGVLRAIADEGHGSFRIAPHLGELDAILGAEIEARASVAARGVGVRITLGPGVRIRGGLPAGLEQEGQTVVLAVPSIAAGAEQVVVIPVDAPAGAGVRRLATVDARWTPAAGGPARSAEKNLDLAIAARPIEAGGAMAVLDADLAAAIAASGTAVAYGDAATAAIALRGHADRARLYVEAHPQVALEARIGHTLAIADALEALVPGASWPDRRALGASMASFSASFSLR